MNAEQHRLEETRIGGNTAVARPWRKWGPYLSEREWGTVREDYSPDGSFWDYFPHEAARSRAYRWGEDGIAGFCDDRQLLCLSLALWNGRDPILKERLFGLTSSEGNHGEDVKECYYYLDATPTHSYLKMLYKYPQAEYPYALLREENKRRGQEDPEFELLDTGIFDDDRYFDVFVEYAKASPEDVMMRVTVHNRGPEEAPIHVLPQLQFRNTWSWQEDGDKPQLSIAPDGAIAARHPELGDYFLYVDGAPELIFCENETNPRRIHGMGDVRGAFKDAFHDYVVSGDATAVNSRTLGTKAAAHHALSIPGGASVSLRLRLTNTAQADPFAAFDATLRDRQREADAFYADLQANIPDAQARAIQRQAFAGMVWGKQYYHYAVWEWLTGDATQPPPPQERFHGRNHEWQHLNNADVVSMPDTWEFPWYAAWDLAFNCLPLALIDPEFAKSQLLLMTHEWYMHPNGQLPAFEGWLSAVHPPVQAWAAWRVFEIDRQKRGGPGDLGFLERVFHKLTLNFTWWVNRKDAQGLNIFQGGFLGLDNIGVFDRGAPLPTGGQIHQADGTAWMAMYSLNLMRIALELAQHNPVYEDIAMKFFQHFLLIAKAMDNIGGQGAGLWDEEDAFYYDVLQLPDDTLVPLKVRSMVGLIPLFAVDTLDPGLLRKLPAFHARLKRFLDTRPDLARIIQYWPEPDSDRLQLLSLVRGRRLTSVLRRMLDETEFLSDYGVRSLSRSHLDEPYVFSNGEEPLSIGYQPGESSSDTWGGNSNWRGPIWFPMNHLIIESLLRHHRYYGDSFKIECPTGSKQWMTLEAVAHELARRLAGIFLPGKDGRRPVHGRNEKLQHDPHFKDHVLFHEYFHGDTGRGAGASHQTGWTGLIANILDLSGEG